MSQSCPDGHSFNLGCLSLFFFAGFAFSTFGFVFGFLRPWYESHAAQTWVQTPCEIRYTSIPSASHPQRPDRRLDYTYAFQGQTYTSHRFQFSAITRSSHHIAPARVALPAPYQGTCFVNPNKPQDAVIRRELDSDAYTGGALTIAFMLLTGGALIIVRIKKAQTS
jgi:hypothetical protein